MSLKAVELQIAIPKTFDAGKVMEQHQQNTIQQQVNANEALKKEVERKQLTVNDTEKISEIADEEDRSNRSDSNSPREKNQHKKNEEQDLKEAKHPYKGNFIDYSG